MFCCHWIQSLTSFQHERNWEAHYHLSAFLFVWLQASNAFITHSTFIDQNLLRKTPNPVDLIEQTGWRVGSDCFVWFSYFKLLSNNFNTARKNYRCFCILFFSSFIVSFSKNRSSEVLEKWPLTIEIGSKILNVRFSIIRSINPKNTDLSL